MSNAIVSFSGEFSFLSNFYPAPVQFDGHEYRTVEHAFQAAKTDDRLQRLDVRLALTPGQAKRLGRKVTLRPGWNDERLQVMRGLLLQKFAPGSTLAGQLVRTEGRPLVEGNVWNDRFWGVCDGRGENHLGLLLMEVRTLVRGRPAVLDACPF